MRKTDADRRIGEMLELVGLHGEKHRIKGFSRGMKQRLGIAQALLSRPKILICDEPTSALDPAGRKEILDTLLSVREETTVLFSTHILSDAERICTDVAILEGGKAVMQGKLSDIRSGLRKDEYVLEMESGEEAACLMNAFSDMRAASENRLVFTEKGKTIHDVLYFAAEKKLRLIKMEKAEPTLENLFMEVTAK